MIFDNGPIVNSRFTWQPKPGTGNKSCKGVTDKEKLRLTNVLIDRAGVDEFLQVLYDSGERKIDVDLSERRTTRRWGTAYILERRVKIFRHTVWILLHELAHILDTKISFATGSIITPAKPHGPDFGRHLTCLYQIWMENCDKGVENLPTKPTAPILGPSEWRRQHSADRGRGRIVDNGLQVGDQVSFPTAKKGTIYAIVKKVNKKTCRVTPVDGGNDWRVSPKLLNKLYKVYTI
jgi:hypothetical protein